uniref:Uncharacterized protein n=1 Tax=Arundo donax TaxID=35708 RepID=A0A0A9BZ98_ARUDO
MWVTLNSYTG